MEKPTFPQRAERMLAAAQDLRHTLELLAQAIPIIEEEAAAMKAAEQRFAIRRSNSLAMRRSGYLTPSSLYPLIAG